ncbi:triphosphoribosyl-dephospho-CoA synthase CitG [Atopobacter phocae]|uniref:triphosphoribosyl-dephospho-CoA synthase CitG n=1 Tax=Atopobacter phocae TaxID=136492 RepID=UPI00046FAD8A|nr:triphosphoribosyl-dephospho-CoA synthase CitG [Atopobacter phocae]
MHKNRLIQLAVKSLIQEASLYPKPGLVDPVDCGSHTDMDYDMFIDSAFALMPGFYRYYELGCHHQSNLSDLFNRIREVGMENERNMFQSTHEVNTHKGANFLYGIVLAAMGYFNQPRLEDVRLAVKEMTKGIVQRELATLQSFRTHGEKVYQQYGFTGIRGEVEEGLPLVFDVALPILREKGPAKTNQKKALLQLIAWNNDSNMIKRGGIEGLKFGQQLAQQTYNDLDQHLIEMNQQFIRKNLNPGGSADLLALSIFLHAYETEWNKITKAH